MVLPVHARHHGAGDLGMCSRRSVCPCEQAQGVTALGFFVRGVACMPAMRSRAGLWRAGVDAECVRAASLLNAGNPAVMAVCLRWWQLYSVNLAIYLKSRRRCSRTPEGAAGGIHSAQELQVSALDEARSRRQHHENKGEACFFGMNEYWVLLFGWQIFKKWQFVPSVPKPNRLFPK